MVSVVGRCWRSCPCLQNAELGGEAGGLVSGVRAAAGNEQSLTAGRRFWSSFTILLEPLQTCPGTALGQLYQHCEGQHGQHVVISPAGLGLKRL